MEVIMSENLYYWGIVCHFCHRPVLILDFAYNLYTFFEREN